MLAYKFDQSSFNPVLVSVIIVAAYLHSVLRYQESLLSNIVN